MGIFHLGGSGGPGDPVIAADVSFDNDASGLAATDVQAAVDEVVVEKLNIPEAVIWERTDWLTLISDSTAPTPAVGGSGWFYFDTAAEELFGPAFFDFSLLPAGVWNWGTALADVVFSVDAPGAEAGDWYVWDENGDGSSFVLFQKKDAVVANDMLFYNGTSWEARSQQIPAENVYADLTNINTDYGVDNVATQLNNLFSNSAMAYNGGNHVFVETNIATTHVISPFDANAHILTITDDVDISFATNWDTGSQLGSRLAEITVVLIQDNVGGHAVTWDAAIKFHSNEDNTSTTANSVGIWKFISWDAGTTWYGHRWGTTFS
jgi:hypothetical protein